MKAISYYNSSHTRRELQAAAAMGLDCCWAAGSWRGALCNNREMYVYHLRAENPVCTQIFRAYTGIGDAETPSPKMLRKSGDLPYPCPSPNKLKRLATRDTLHGSRPNLRQRDPNGRIVPTPPNVSDKGTSTKRYAREKKK